jgi:hypothetical protein
MEIEERIKKFCNRFHAESTLIQWKFKLMKLMTKKKANFVREQMIHPDGCRTSKEVYLWLVGHICFVKERIEKSFFYFNEYIEKFEELTEGELEQVLLRTFNKYFELNSKKGLESPLIPSSYSSSERERNSMNEIRSSSLSSSSSSSSSYFDSELEWINKYDCVKFVKRYCRKEFVKFSKISLKKEDDPRNFFFVFQGFGVERTQLVGEVAEALDKWIWIFEICLEVEEVHHLLDFFAKIIQFPGMKTNLFLLIKSGQGTGKNSFLKPIQNILKKYSNNSMELNRITNRFNESRLANKVLILCNEIGEFPNRNLN